MTRVKVNDVILNYEDVGNGEAIVFLHGFTGSNRDWINQMNVVKTNYRGVAIDFRGHGQSDAPIEGEEYSIYLNCEDIYQLLGHLRISKCVLVGHSMGGFTALQYVLDHPLQVKGLVLVDTSSGEWDVAPGYIELRLKLDELARTEGLAAAFEYDADNNPMRIERFKRHPEQREIARQKTLGTALNAYIYVPRSFGRWLPVTKRLHEIKAPTIIFRGEEDLGFVRASNILRDSISGANLVIVPGTYHNPHEESPDFFNDAFLRFLKKIDW